MDKSSSKLCITQSQTHLVKNLALDLKTSVIISNVAMDIGVHAPFQIIMFSWKTMASGPITSWEVHGETGSDFIFLGSQITAGGDCSHEIKRHLLLGSKVMINLDNILKSRDIILPTKCLSHQRYGFSSSLVWI